MVIMVVLGMQKANLKERTEWKMLLDPTVMRIERSPLCQQQQPVGCMILVAAHRGAGEAIDTHQATPYHIKPHHTISNHTISHHTIPHHTTPHQTMPNWCCSRRGHWYTASSWGRDWITAASRPGCYTRIMSCKRNRDCNVFVADRARDKDSVPEKRGRWQNVPFLILRSKKIPIYHLEI